MTARQSNLLGAASIGIADRIRASAEHAAGRAGQAPAALTVLAQHAALGIETLRRHLDLSQPATVRLVDALVGDGLVRRRPGRDARSLTVELTAAGRRRATAVLAARRAVLDAALKRLSAGDRSALEALLGRLLEQLPDDPEQADVLCRLCDFGGCPLGRCPVERTVGHTGV